MLCFVLLIRKNFIEYLVVRVLKKYGINVRLSIKGQIKLKNLKSVGTPVNMNCSKWKKMKVCILCIHDLQTVNTLGALEKTFSNCEKVKKIIRSLKKEWIPKRSTIEEAKKLNTLFINDLIGSLISYEEDLVAEKGHEKKKKKSIVLKASKHESDKESELDDEEMAMITRRFRKFYKKTNERRKFRNFKNQKEKKEQISCYECKKPGHIRSECPLLNKFKKKAMVATWDDSNEETSDDEEHQEMTNLALIAIGEE